MPTPTDLGVDLRMVFDIDGTGDIDPTGATVTGPEAVAQALACRLVTPEGQLFYDPRYGFDLRKYVEKKLTPAQLLNIRQRVEEQCRMDERVLEVEVELIPPVKPSDPLIVNIDFSSIVGKGRLILAVSAVTVQILKVLEA